MTVACLDDVLGPAMRQGYAVAGLVVLGWEDACAYVEAAEEVGIPIILQAGPGCRKHQPVPVLGRMFRHLAEQASVPVVCHIDHAYTLDECREGIDHGFTSVMFDGSRLPIAENIETTARIAEFAHAAGVSVEGEVGFVGYADGAASAATDPQEAAWFDQASGADALAVSVGNVHLQRQPNTPIDRNVLSALEAVTRLPLVLHGGSGIPEPVRTQIARNTRVCKINIGTELRMAFSASLRETLDAHAHEFDRNALLGATIEPVKRAAVKVITALYHSAEDTS